MADIMGAIVLSLVVYVVVFFVWILAMCEAKGLSPGEAIKYILPIETYKRLRENTPLNPFGAFIHCLIYCVIFAPVLIVVGVVALIDLIIHLIFFNWE